MTKDANRGKNAPSVNKQGHPEGSATNPKSQLEQKAMKSNTKI